MIITKIQGGLGNQLFQYAYARNISNLYDIDFILDDSVYLPNSNRNFELDKFENIKIKTYNNDIIQCTQLNDDFNYRNIVFNKDQNYYLNGYWQSEKYFKESEELIRSDLRASNEIMDTIYRYPISSDNITSMHIRRGDYVSLSDYHPLQTIEYYTKALELIGDYDYLYIFSDDLEWCYKNLNFERMIFIDTLTNIESLYLMSFCKNNIIANSSLSWWGAWLNNNPNKKVIAPTNWFGSKTNLNTSDIIPDSWIKLNL